MSVESGQLQDDRVAPSTGIGLTASDRYHKRVEWSEEDRVYLGKCPDLITGIHGDDPIQLNGDICDLVDEVLAHFQAEGRALPPSRTHPMQEVA